MSNGWKHKSIFISLKQIGQSGRAPSSSSKVLAGYVSFHLSTWLPWKLASHSSRSFLYVAVLYNSRLAVWKGKVLVKEEDIFFYISNKYLTIVSFWPGFGHIIIYKLIMVAKGTDCFNWPGLSYVSRLRVRVKSTIWTKIGEGMIPKRVAVIIKEKTGQIPWINS